MAIDLNHTIVYARDPAAAATDHAELLRRVGFCAGIR
jgi:hypothetical protein